MYVRGVVKDNEPSIILNICTVMRKGHHYEAVEDRGGRKGQDDKAVKDT